MFMKVKPKSNFFFKISITEPFQTHNSLKKIGKIGPLIQKESPPCFFYPKKDVF